MKFLKTEKRIFDIILNLDKGLFSYLKDLNKFNSAHVAAGTIQWENEEEFYTDSLFKDRCIIKSKLYINFIFL